MENIIKIHLKSKDDYKNIYNEEILSYALSNYILEELKGLSTKAKIKFVISTDFEIILPANSFANIVAKNKRG